ncbi:quinone oxidoreductase-like protein 2 isoform X2 [Temnothorax longispinosus]|uniref:quinone oxidoreductase-like protein 2 isoform X2 n=1 Tax=Temnothorax longispinosus TaxID=300112 RepID=UPI003A98E58E
MRFVERSAWTCASAGSPEATCSSGAANTAEPRSRPWSSVSRCRARFWKWADWHTRGQATRWARKSSCTTIPSAAVSPRAVWLITELMRRVSLKNAAAVTDDYFSALLAIGRRARIQRNECLLVNARHSHSALAVIDLATRVFGAKPIALCDDAKRAELCADLGATVIRRSGHCLPYKLKKIGGKEEVRVMIETEGGPCFRNAIKCLEYDGLVGVLGGARNKRSLDLSFMPANCTMFAVAAEHYKVADALVETMQHVLDYKSECAIRPRISAIFGLHRVNDAFNYHATVPSGKVLIDMKDRDRLTLCEP